MTDKSTAGPPQTTVVALNTLAIAPENVRANLPADAGIPQLWQTLKAAGQLYVMLVRPGKKGEADHMILDGRRRFLAFSHGVEIGDIPADHCVKVQIETDKNRQLAATLLTASETEPTHLVDIIRTIRVLRDRKMKTGSIAEALGYEKIQIDRWGALATLSDDALEALRAGKLTFRQATLLTKIADTETQAALVQQAVNGSLYDQSISSMIVGARITAADPRVRLVGLSRYTAAGGRIESDLFNETPDILLDPDKLQTAWTECARPLCVAMKDSGLAVFVSFDRQYTAPDGFQGLPVEVYGGGPGAGEARDEAMRELTAARNALRDIDDFDDTTTDALLTYVERSLAYAQTRVPGEAIGAVIVCPDKDFGLSLTYFTAVPAPQEEQPQVQGSGDASEGDGSTDRVALASDGASAPKVHRGATREDYEPTEEVKLERAAAKLVEAPREPVVTIEARTNGLHERYTDLATRGLIRAVADEPETALNILLARLFVKIAVQPWSSQQESATTIEATPYSRTGVNPHPALDGDVRARLEERRLAFIEAGVRPIAWISTLAHGEKMTMLAELTALSLDLVEPNTKVPRNGARADAAEIAETIDHDFTNFTTPDEAFFAAHGKTELLKMLERFDPAASVEASSLRKDDLAAFVAERAAEHRWAPDALSWRQSTTDAAVADTEGDASAEPQDAARAALAEQLGAVFSGETPADDEATTANQEPAEQSGDVQEPTDTALAA